MDIDLKKFTLAQLAQLATKFNVGDAFLQAAQWKLVQWFRQPDVCPRIIDAKWLNFKGRQEGVWESPDVLKESTTGQGLRWSYEWETQKFTLRALSYGSFASHDDGHPLAEWSILINDEDTLAMAYVRVWLEAEIGWIVETKFDEEEEARVKKRKQEIFGNLMKDALK